MEWMSETMKELPVNDTTIITKRDLLMICENVDTSLECLKVILRTFDDPNKSLETISSIKVLQNELKWVLRWTREKGRYMGVDIGE